MRARASHAQREHTARPTHRCVLIADQDSTVSGAGPRVLDAGTARTQPAPVARVRTARLGRIVSMPPARAPAAARGRTAWAGAPAAHSVLPGRSRAVPRLPASLAPRALSAGLGLLAVHRVSVELMLLTLLFAFRDGPYTRTAQFFFKTFPRVFVLLGMPRISVLMSVMHASLAHRTKILQAPPHASFRLGVTPQSLALQVQGVVELCATIRPDTRLEKIAPPIPSAILANSSL